ncbi:hypothetical protein BVY01_01680 [bacterium I07]|nr:hypothetical protein BVY01_01680 [bacterium I07]
MVQTNSNSKQPRKRLFWIIIKILVSAAAVAYLISRIEFAHITTELKSVNRLTLSISFLIFSGWILACPMRWRLIAQQCGYGFSLNESIRYYLIGTFFSAFLPTGKGGDIVRGVLLSRQRGYSMAGILGTVLLERFIGFLAALIIVIVASLSVLTKFAQSMNIIISAIILVLIISVSIFILLHPVFRKILQTLLEKIPIVSLRNASGELLRVFEECRNHPRTIVYAVGLSVLNLLVHIVSASFMAAAIINFHAPWYSFFVVIPLTFIAQLLPSIGGFGIRETGYVIFFGWFGVRSEAAVIFGLLHLLFITVYSLSGAVLFLQMKWFRNS